MAIKAFLLPALAFASTVLGKRILFPPPTYKRVARAILFYKEIYVCNYS